MTTIGKTIILTNLLAIIAFNAGAQRYLADTSVWKGLVLSNGTIETDSGYIIPHQKPKTDTIHAIFLITDTTFGRHNPTPVYFANGYAVREWHNGKEIINDVWCYNCPDYWSTIEYLNSNKEPFQKKVIWQAKLLTE